MRWSRLTFIALLIFLLAGHQLPAQNKQEEQKVRKVYQNALELVLQDYKWACKVFTGDELENDFKPILTEQAMIANDVLPANQLNEQLGATDYAKELIYYYDEYKYSVDLAVTYVSTVNFHNQDYSKGDLTLYVEKAIEGVYDDYDTKYRDTLSYKFDVEFNGVNGTYRISGIDLLEEQGKYCFLEPYQKSLSGKEPMTNKKLIVGDRTVKTDNSGRVFLKDVKGSVNVKTTDRRIYEEQQLRADAIGNNSQQGVDDNVVPLTFKLPYFYAEISGGYVPGVPVSLGDDGAIPVNITSGNEINYNAGMDFGLILYRNEWSRYSVSLGANYSKVAYQLGKDEHTIKSDEQVRDGVAYTREVTVSGIKETHQMAYLNTPLRANALVHAYKDHYVDVGVGIGYNLNLEGQYETSANGQYTAVYGEEYFNLRISDEEVYEELGSSTLNAAENLELAQSFMTWQVNLGWQYRLSRRLFLQLGGKYEASTRSIFQEGNKRLSWNKGELNSLTNIKNKIFLDRFSINVGLSMNL